MAAAEPSGCHCLCQQNHPDAMGVCTGQVDTSVAFDSPTTGRVDVPMCSACTAATLATKQETVAKEGGG